MNSTLKKEPSPEPFIDQIDFDEPDDAGQWWENPLEMYVDRVNALVARRGGRVTEEMDIRNTSAEEDSSEEEQNTQPTVIRPRRRTHKKKCPLDAVNEEQNTQPTVIKPKRKYTRKRPIAAVDEEPGTEETTNPVKKQRQRGRPRKGRETIKSEPSETPQ